MLKMNSKEKTLVLRHIDSYMEVVNEPSGVTIGNFDGVHKGHIYLIEKLIQSCSRRGLKSVLLTFDPHPADILHLGEKKTRLTEPEHKIALLLKTGIDVLIVHPFDRYFARLKAKRFITEMLIGKLRAELLVVGADFRFGYNKEGDMKLLRQAGEEKGLKIVEVPFIKTSTGIISSTRVRKLLRERGDIQQVNELLGRLYMIEGQVVEGSGVGHKLGFPTANLRDVKVCLPASGVYAGGGEVDGKLYPAVVHIGRRKTFDDEFTIEVHLINMRMEDSLYMRKIKFYFLKRLRDVRKFSSPESLKRQIEEDVSSTLEIFTEAKILEKT